MANILMIAPLNAANFDSGNAEAGKVLTADGSGGAAFEAVVGGDNDWLIDALGGGRHTPASTATGGDAFAVGTNNEASGDYATVGGGKSNTASSDYATVGGGKSNTASGSDTTVGGGYSNTASGHRATVGGGNSNTASGQNATVGGGYSNTADGEDSAILGGTTNDTNGLASAMIVGSNITASLAHALHCNKLVVTQIPVASAGLPSGTVWSDGGTLKIIP